MKAKQRTIAMMVLLLAAALVFAACSADNDETGHPDGQLADGPAAGETAGNQEENPTGGNGGDAGDGTLGGDAGDEPAMEEPPAETMEVELEVEGMKETRTGTLVVSESNGYYMYIIPPFVYTPEEPNADMVYMEAFPDYAMRIQTLPTETDLALVRDNAEEELRLVNESIQALEGDDIYDPYLQGAVFYLQAMNEEILKKIILLEVDGRPFKFTMFLPVGGEASEGAESGFNAMIKTLRTLRG